MPQRGAASCGGEGQPAAQAIGPSGRQVVVAPGAPGAATWLRRRTSQSCIGTLSVLERSTSTEELEFRRMQGAVIIMSSDLLNPAAPSL